MQGVPASRQPVWPELKRSCLPAQVLDDSTCKVTRQLVDEKAAEWAERGIKCEVVRRTNRQGYKAGALKDVSPLTARLPASAVFCQPPYAMLARSYHGHDGHSDWGFLSAQAGQC